MTLESRPLLRSSTEIIHSSHRRRHLNRTMSLRAALLAFPLPRDTAPPHLVRRHTTALHHHRPSPLSSYNSNYTRLTTERHGRIKARKSYAPSIPEYALPTSYSEIERIFPVHDSDSSSMIVEFDSPKDFSSPGFSMFEDPPSPPKRTGNRAREKLYRGRERELFEGEIASVRN